MGGNTRELRCERSSSLTALDQSALWNELAEACADRGVIFRQFVVMPKPKLGKYHVEDAENGQYFVSLETVPQDFLTLAVKRVLDIAGSILGAIVCALGIPLLMPPSYESSRRARFCSARSRWDANGRFFTLYKFHTVRPDAERELPKLTALNQMNRVRFKIKTVRESLPVCISCAVPI